MLTAFKRQVDAAAVPPKIFSPTSFKNFEKLFAGKFPGSLVNSVIITADDDRRHAGASACPAGYAFARGQFRGPASSWAASCCSAG